MPFRLRVSLAILLALLLTVVLGPLVIPIRELDDTVPASQLAGPDSRFIAIGGLEIHYQSSVPPRSAGPPPLMLLHGFGSSTYSWHEVIDPLGDLSWALAFDRPAFGLSDRPQRGEWQSTNPYSPEGQLRLTLDLMDAFDIDRTVLIGHAAGGALAVKLALDHPDRVAGLVLVDAAILREGGAPAWSRPLLFTPQMNRVGPLLMRQFGGASSVTFVEAAWSDPDRIDDETYQAFRRPLRVEGWDRALWEFSRSSRRLNLQRRLPEVAVPTLVISGADDRIVPVEQSEEVARAIPGSTLAVFDGCGHVPHEECPARFIEVVQGWLADQEPFE